jgi:hypothetical protein
MRVRMRGVARARQRGAVLFPWRFHSGFPIAKPAEFLPSAVRVRRVERRRGAEKRRESSRATSSLGRLASVRYERSRDEIAGLLLPNLVETERGKETARFNRDLIAI